MFGDLVGTPGLRAFLSALPSLRIQYGADLVIVNGENASPDGLGLLVHQCEELFAAGVDVITTGNHVWEKRELWPLLETEKRLLRPDNYPRRLPGRGSVIIEVNGQSVGILNLQGRTRMSSIDDPFERAKHLIEAIRPTTPLIFVDFHGEAPEEKEAFAFWLDGLVTAVVGTHTHVQTADERILPQGTATITDLGMCGPAGSVIGGDPDVSVERSLTLVPLRSEISTAPGVVRGVAIVADPSTGRARSVVRFAV